MAKFCMGCGKELADGIRFCAACGTPVPVQEQQAISAEAPMTASVSKSCGTPKEEAAEQKSPSAPPAASQQTPLQERQTIPSPDPALQENRKPVTGTKKSKKRLAICLSVIGGCAAVAAVLVFCFIFNKPPAGETSVPKNLTATQALDETVKSLDTYFSEAEKLYYAGFTYQADWYYSYAAATAASLRTCLDASILAKGGTVPEDAAERLSDWEEIGKLNLSCPIVWVCESITYLAQGKNTESDAAWKNAQQYPAYKDAAQPDDAFTQESVGDLIAARTKVAEFEDKLAGAFTPAPVDYRRDPKGWDDGYLCSLGTAALEADETDYAGAMKHYKAALAADPFDGGNFAACALMSLYEEDLDAAALYVSEGLKIAPDHEGLNHLADIMVAAAKDAENTGGDS